MADREKSTPVTNETVFDIGSVSKVFTATSIMMLVDEGKVSLDKPVIDYLPDFKMANELYRYGGMKFANCTAAVFLHIV